MSMEGRRANIFVSFRGPSERNNAADPGKQLEDNTTKAHLHLVDFGDNELIQAILDATTKNLEIRSDVLDTVTADNVTTNTQVQISDINTGGRTLALVGVSGTGHDPLENEDYEPTNEDVEESKKRVDGVIYVDDKYAIIQESKFQGEELGTSEMGDYKSLLQVQDENYATVSWKRVHNNIESILGGQDTSRNEPSNRSNFLASQFKRYLEIHGLKLSESESQYSSGQKFISLRFQPNMNVVTPAAESSSPEYAVHFHSLPKKDGISDFYISQGELEALLEHLENSHPELRSALQKGNFEPLDEFANKHNITQGGTKEIAEIGNQEEGRKRLQISQTRNGNHRVLGFRRASPGSGQYSGSPYYMLAAEEFRAHFSLEDAEGATTIGDALFGTNPNIMDLQ